MATAGQQHRPRPPSGGEQAEDGTGVQDRTPWETAAEQAKPGHARVRQRREPRDGACAI